MHHAALLIETLNQCLRSIIILIVKHVSTLTSGVSCFYLMFSAFTIGPSQHFI